jgi:hypothetical protein
VEEEQDVEQDGEDEEKHREDPDDESEKHTRQNEGLAVIIFGDELDLLEELGDGTLHTLVVDYEVGLVD